MPGVFISYRRSDTADYAARLNEHLSGTFGGEYVFMDVDSLRPGEPFPEVIDSTITTSDVVLALIGRDWLTVTDASGKRRLEDPGDFVRIEVATAIRLERVVIPVLLEDASMPGQSALPEPLVELAERHAIVLTDENWDQDVHRLVRRLESFGELRTGEPTLGSTRRRALVSDAAVPARSSLPVVSANKGAGGEAAAVERRRTPLDPYPEPRPTPTGEAKRPHPTELGPDAIALLEGRTFMFSDARGDVTPGTVGGLVHEDTRFVSRWELRLDGRPLSLLKSGPVDYDSAAFFLTNPDTPRLRAHSVAVRRLRLVGDGALEQISVFNTASEAISCELRLRCAADFADLFEIRDRVRDRGERIVATVGAGRRSLRFRYEVPGFLAETTIRIERCEIVEGDTEHVVAAVRPRITGTDAVWKLELPPRCSLVTLVKVGVRVNNVTFEPVTDGLGTRQERVEGPLSGWLERIPRIEAESTLLDNVVRQSVVDLAALRVTGDLLGESYVLPAAGLPWFMTLFGRDTLITSLQTLWVGPLLARGALHLLGALQGTRVDDFRDEEPGKILHEVRSGELTRLGEKPHSPYYGTADATPLWLILLSEYWRFTGQDEFVLGRWEKIAAALAWIDEYGDRDGDGYVEYQTRSREGLGNQCWKDSWDGVQFADGTIPHLPIATAEIQGYVYDAKLRVAELARCLRSDVRLAERLEREAAQLYARFNDDFWSDDRGGYYVIGLDGDKRRIDSMTSNMGHLLWSGIVPAERAGLVAAQLMSEPMFSGWGVRTLSTDDRGYNPIGYHVGTIWPHDNSIVALGLARAGFRDEANRIAVAQLEAAAFTGYRLPEAFAGFERSVSRFPVPYPTACSPQAWATAAPFVFVQAMLGLEARDGELRLDPHVPEEIGRICVRRLHAFGEEWDLEAAGAVGVVRRSESEPRSNARTGR